MPCRSTHYAMPCRSIYYAVPFLSLAFKNLDKRVEQFEEERWRDMGAVFLNFAVYAQPDGHLVIDPYDHIAKVMGVQTTTFISLHKNKVNEIMRLLMDYVKSVRQSRIVNERLNGSQVNEVPLEREVKLSDSGFPLIPSIDHFDNLRKAELDIILRAFLGCHYSAYLPFRNHLTNKHTRIGIWERLCGSI